MKENFLLYTIIFLIITLFSSSSVGLFSSPTIPFSSSHRIFRVVRKESSDVFSVIQERIEGRFDYIKKEGAILFDVDNTLLAKEGEITQEEEKKQVQKAVETLIDILKETKCGIVSGNAYEVQKNRLISPLIKNLREEGQLELLENFVAIAEGGGSIVTYKVEDNKIMKETPVEFSEKVALREKQIAKIKNFFEDFIQKGELLKLYQETVKEVLGEEISKLSLQKAIGKAYADLREKYERKIRNTIWIKEGKSNFDISVFDSAKEEVGEVSAPWLEKRYEEGTNLIKEVTLKPFPSTLEIDGREVDLEKKLRNKIIDKLEKENLLSDKYSFYPGGSTSIDIGINKAESLKYFFETHDLNKNYVLYIGDEWERRGNDTPVLNVEGLIPLSVGKIDPETKRIIDPKNRIVSIGNSPSDTLKFSRKLVKKLPKYLYKPTWLGENERLTPILEREMEDLIESESTPRKPYIEAYNQGILDKWGFKHYKKFLKDEGLTTQEINSEIIEMYPYAVNNLFAWQKLESEVFSIPNNPKVLLLGCGKFSWGVFLSHYFQPQQLDGVDKKNFDKEEKKEIFKKWGLKDNYNEGSIKWLKGDMTKLHEIKDRLEENYDLIIMRTPFRTLSHFLKSMSQAEDFLSEKGQLVLYTTETEIEEGYKVPRNISRTSEELDINQIEIYPILTRIPLLPYEKEDKLTIIDKDSIPLFVKRVVKTRTRSP